jgi:hypothetical protein
LQQYSGAIAGERIRAGRPAVRQVLQDLQTLLDDGVTFSAPNIRARP